MSIWWSLHLRREAASVPFARRLLVGTMETAGVDPDISFDLSVALSEACANAVEHGGGEGPGGPLGAYRVTAYLDGEKCRIEVADSGPGFPARHGSGPARSTTEAGGKPGSAGAGTGTAVMESADSADTANTAAGPGAFVRQAPPTAESGRGLCLIEELADHVQFSSRPGRGAVVSFDKALKWREGALLRVS
jgi:serine/threonine-protein kinase RsbW